MSEEKTNIEKKTTTQQNIREDDVAGKAKELLKAIQLKIEKESKEGGIINQAITKTKDILNKVKKLAEERLNSKEPTKEDKSSEEENKTEKNQKNEVEDLKEEKENSEKESVKKEEIGKGKGKETKNKEEDN